jgi:UPF0755 protein
MRPNDDPALNIPSAPPPSDLPRPRLRTMSDIRPVQPNVEVPAPATSTGPQTPVVSAQPVQPATHPAEELLIGPGQQDTKLIALPPMPPLDDDVRGTPPKPKRSKLKIFLSVFLGLIVVGIIAAGSAFWWYQQQLQPVTSSADAPHKRLVIASGSAPSAIAAQLEEAGLVRSSRAFQLYIQLTGTRDSLKAGSYNLQPSLSVPQIVDHLVSGKQDEFKITFLPGDTLANHRKQLLGVGYSESEIDAAFSKAYTSPLFDGKPASADLEGYIYGETYQFDTSASVEDVLTRTFEEFEGKVEANKLVEGFKKQGLTLYEGITLASVVQREIGVAADQKQVAAVFYNRMKAGMTLGSDVTYQYAAKKLGVAPDPTLESPYNTRIHKGLPPGPIASPGLGALTAVAYPASNDYLFFLSGDDDKTYFGRTNEEHEQNVANHCQKKCLIN